MPKNILETTCCITGGGPAGVMLGYLLARSGVHVAVLEKHADFFRDFRGDTVHPSTLQVLDELNLLDDFLKMPHQQVDSVGGMFGDFPFEAADFRHLPGQYKFAVLMPQWDFLNFLSERAKEFPAFDLRMEHEVVELMRDHSRVTGVIAHGRRGDKVEIRAKLVVGCDGRHSVVRAAAQLPLTEFGVPIDVLWFRISRKPSDPEEVAGLVNYGKALVLIDRGDYFQAGLIIRKGSFDEIKRDGLGVFQASILRIAPFFGSRVGEVDDWDKIKILTVQLNRLRRWHQPGLLCIGDAAHAMSPAGGVGINLAIQDAVAAANILSRPLKKEAVSESDLAAVQRRRELPTRITQAAQMKIHEQFAKVFENPGPVKAPWQFKLVTNLPGVHRAIGYAIGIGIRPEHVRKASRRWPVVIGAAIGATAAIAAILFSRRRVPKPQEQRQQVPTLRSHPELPAYR